MLYISIVLNCLVNILINKIDTTYRLLIPNLYLCYVKVSTKVVFTLFKHTELSLF